MENNKKIQLLRIFYWYGIILDFIFGLLDIYRAFFDPSIINNGWQMAYWYRGISIFLYTFVLIWADRKPVERRFVILGIIIGISCYAFGEIMIGFFITSFDWSLRIFAVVIPFSICYVLTMNIEQETIIL